MIIFEEFAEILDEIATALPKEIYVRLNGGVNLQPGLKIHPESLANDLFTLGEYNYNELGRYINIYYGSFSRMYYGLSKDALKIEIERVLKHEFIHHLESLAGENDLEVEDMVFLEKYRKGLLG
ncbi:MAG: metallopeptidase family protein [Defluviitaleaceae bacterium]|nr:metallopeptidase family protein [Defluviitaleaceae bacterium]